MCAALISNVWCSPGLQSNARVFMAGGGGVGRERMISRHLPHTLNLHADPNFLDTVNFGAFFRLYLRTIVCPGPRRTLLTPFRMILLVAARF